MELYRYENGKLIKFNGGFVVYNNRIYTNPTEEMVRKVGYKDLVYDNQPEYNVETHYLEQEIEEQETSILVHWKVHEIPMEQTDEEYLER